MKQDGNFRSSGLFYDYYNIYNIISDLISTIYTTANQFLSSCVPVNTSRDT